jgi:hypothetical protein
MTPSRETLLALAREAGAQGALALIAMRVAERRGLCGPLQSWDDVRAAARELHRRTSGALPPWPLPRRQLLTQLTVEDDSLTQAAEVLAAQRLGVQGRRRAGVYYTPREIADRVVELALQHGSIDRPRVRDGSISSDKDNHGPIPPRKGPLPPRGKKLAEGSDIPLALDPCAGAGAFLVAAARAGLRRCAAMDLDADALRVARAALALEGVLDASFVRGDSLREAPPPADLLVSNPPYGRLDEPLERAALAARFPALRGGEIDRYTACILRATGLVRPGGTAALLVPDTWMSNARSGSIRAAVLEAAEVAAIVDLGKPFAAAKDTRVQALVLVSRPAGGARTAFVGRHREVLAPVARGELARTAVRGWHVYRSDKERALMDAMDKASIPLGDICEVGYGMRTGNNPRHVERRPPARGEIGLVGGEDILPFALRWKPKTLLDGAPLSRLVERQQGRERVAIQRIRTNAQAPWARWLEAAMVPRELVCLDSLSTLWCEDVDRLWALLGLVSSVALNRYHRLRTTDVNVKPGLLRELPVPRALFEDARLLAQLARRRAGSGETALERAIDTLVYRAFGLPEELVDEAEHGFWGSRFFEERQRLGPPMSDPCARVAGVAGSQGETP